MNQHLSNNQRRPTSLVSRATSGLLFRRPDLALGWTRVCWRPQATSAVWNRWPRCSVDSRRSSLPVSFSSITTFPRMPSANAARWRSDDWSARHTTAERGALSRRPLWIQSPGWSEAVHDKHISSSLSSSSGLLPWLNHLLGWCSDDLFQMVPSVRIRSPNLTTVQSGLPKDTSKSASTLLCVSLIWADKPGRHDFKDLISLNFAALQLH